MCLCGMVGGCFGILGFLRLVNFTCFEMRLVNLAIFSGIGWIYGWVDRWAIYCGYIIDGFVDNG